MAGAYSVTLFRHSVIPSFQLCPSVIIWFPFIISATVQHNQLKFDIWIHHRKMQVKFEVGHGLMIFDRVSPLELGKKSEIFRFCSLSLLRLHTFNSDLIYGYATVHAFEKLSISPLRISCTRIHCRRGHSCRTDTSCCLYQVLLFLPSCAVELWYLEHWYLEYHFYVKVIRKSQPLVF